MAHSRSQGDFDFLADPSPFDKHLLSIKRRTSWKKCAHLFPPFLTRHFRRKWDKNLAHFHNCTYWQSFCPFLFKVCSLWQLPCVSWCRCLGVRPKATEDFCTGVVAAGISGLVGDPISLSHDSILHIEFKTSWQSNVIWWWDVNIFYRHGFMLHNIAMTFNTTPLRS